MSVSVFAATKRDKRGTRASRKLREQGLVPAVLYGHGEDVVSLTLKVEDVMGAIRRRQHVVELKGELEESALLKDVQWNAFGDRVLHVDLTRVSRGELAEATLEIALHGEPAGVSEGGQVDVVMREITIECPVYKIPAQIDLNIAHLKLGDSIVAGDIELPLGAKLQVPEDSTVVQCIERAVEEAPEETEEAAVEPEVIGRSEASEEEE